MYGRCGSASCAPNSSLRRRAVACTSLLTKVRVKKGASTPVSPISDGRADKKAAAIVGVGRSTVARAKTIQKCAPKVVDHLRSGEINMCDAERMADSNPGHAPLPQSRRDANGRVQPAIFYGNGDKWRESFEPLTRTLGKRCSRCPTGAQLGHTPPLAGILCGSPVCSAWALTGSTPQRVVWTPPVQPIARVA